MMNPFQYGKVAERDHFIDRDNDRRFLKQTLYSGVNVILVSPRRWGKSSLVKMAMHELCDEHDDVRVCHIDAFPITSSEEFYHVFARAVLKATSSHVQAVMDSVGRFLKSIAPKVSFSPEPMSEFSLSFSIDGSELEAREVLNLPERIALEKGIRVIVCIDEFQKLAKLPDYEKLEALMRSVWQHQQSVSYCLYGSQRHMMEDIFNSPEKPFFRFGQMYPLPKIEACHWVEYIQRRFQGTGRHISPELATRITETAECHSWYVQQLASAVWNFVEAEADAAAFDKAFTWCVDVNSETYRNVCDALTEAQIGMLRAIASGEQQLSAADTIKRYRMGTSAAVTKNKRLLTRLDLIASGKAGCTFLDPIFRVWFERNYLKTAD